VRPLDLLVGFLVRGAVRFLFRVLLPFLFLVASVVVGDWLGLW